MDLSCCSNYSVCLRSFTHVAFIAIFHDNPSDRNTTIQKVSVKGAKQYITKMVVAKDFLNVRPPDTSAMTIMLLAVGVHVNKHATKIAYDLVSDAMELAKNEFPKLATQAQTIAGHMMSFTMTIPRVEGQCIAENPGMSDREMPKMSMLSGTAAIPNAVIPFRKNSSGAWLSSSTPTNKTFRAGNEAMTKPTSTAITGGTRTVSNNSLIFVCTRNNKLLRVVFKNSSSKTRGSLSLHTSVVDFSDFSSALTLAETMSVNGSLVLKM